MKKNDVLKKGLVVTMMGMAMVASSTCMLSYPALANDDIEVIIVDNVDRQNEEDTAYEEEPEQESISTKLYYYGSKADDETVYGLGVVNIKTSVDPADLEAGEVDVEYEVVDEEKDTFPDLEYNGKMYKFAPSDSEEAQMEGYYTVTPVNMTVEMDAKEGSNQYNTTAQTNTYHMNFMVSFNEAKEETEKKDTKKTNKETKVVVSTPVQQTSKNETKTPATNTVKNETTQVQKEAAVTTHTVQAHVQYFAGATLDEAKAKTQPDAVDEVQSATSNMTEAATVSVNPNTTNEFTGYRYDSMEGNTSYTVNANQTDGEIHVAKVYYVVNQYAYTVKYVDQATNKEISSSTTNKANYQSVVKASDVRKEVKGYTYTKDTGDMTVSENEAGNVMTVYYRSNNTASSVNTGTETNMPVYASMAAASLAGVMAVILAKKRFSK